MRLKVPASFYQVWAITSGAYMMGGRCPCCGSQGCPVGLGAAVLVGGGIAGVAHGIGTIGKIANRKKTGMDKDLKAERINGGEDS